MQKYALLNTIAYKCIQAELIILCTMASPKENEEGVYWFKETSKLSQLRYVLRGSIANTDKLQTSLTRYNAKRYPHETYNTPYLCLK